MTVQAGTVGARLLEQIRTRTARNVIIGLGYVGLPLAVEHARAGFAVVGIDRDAGRVAALNAGQTYIPDVDEATLRNVVRAGRLRGSAAFDAVTDAETVTICVPTPLDRGKRPDMSHIEFVIGQCIPRLRSGQLLVLESTTYPGTTEELLLPQMRARGLVVGEDVFLAFSPERVDPGNQRFPLRNIPKVVGGVTGQCSAVSRALYEAVLDSPVHVVSSPRAAEMTKLLENVFRIVNVSLVNELAMLADRMGIDLWEVIEAASTKPFGFMPFHPGPGMGGHCIPIDAFYLASKAKEYDFPTRFIELAGEINDQMPAYVVQRTAEILNEHRKPLAGARVLLLGMAYKRDVGDVRESPAVRIAAALLRRGVRLQYHDPHVPEVLVDGRPLRSVPLSGARLAGCDLVLITTNHRTVDYDLVVAHAPLIYDTRNALVGRDGAHVHRLGRGTPAATSGGTAAGPIPADAGADG